MHTCLRKLADKGVHPPNHAKEQFEKASPPASPAPCPRPLQFSWLRRNPARPRCRPRAASPGRSLRELQPSETLSDVRSHSVTFRLLGSRGARIARPPPRPRPAAQTLAPGPRLKGGIRFFLGDDGQSSETTSHPQQALLGTACSTSHDADCQPECGDLTVSRRNRLDLQDASEPNQPPAAAAAEEVVTLFLPAAAPTPLRWCFPLLTHHSMLVIDAALQAVPGVRGKDLKMDRVIALS